MPSPLQWTLSPSHTPSFVEVNKVVVRGRERNTILLDDVNIQIAATCVVGGLAWLDSADWLQELRRRRGKSKQLSC
jgi:hypothetical protein